MKCSIPDSTHATKDNGTDANGQEIVFTGINTVHKFSKTGKTAKAINHKVTGLISETDFFAEPQDIDSLNELSPVITGISVLPTSATIAVEETTTLNATLTPSTASGTITWTAVPPTIASVSSTGVVTGIETGTAVVTATCGTKSAFCTVTVTQA